MYWPLKKNRANFFKFHVINRKEPFYLHRTEILLGEITERQKTLLINRKKELDSLNNNIQNNLPEINRNKKIIKMINYRLNPTKRIEEVIEKLFKKIEKFETKI